MKVVKGSQIQKLDKISIEKYGIPGIILMENAGLSVFQEVLKSLSHRENKKVTIISGIGNNGGDGFVVARHLFQRGIPVKVLILGSPSAIGGDAKINYDIIQRLNIDFKAILGRDDLNKISESIKESSIIVDGIFGTGLTRKIEGYREEVIQMINDSGKEVISIDIPSGISADDGMIYGIAIRANKTVVFQLPKIGNINYPGAEYGGEMILKDIGIPQVAIDNMNINIHLITQNRIRNILPCRGKDTHKGTYGKAYVIAGSLGMTGAAMLTCKAVLRSGAGLLKLAIPQSLNTIVESELIETITVPLPELKKGVIGITDIQKIIHTMDEANVIAVGPGSGRSRELEELLRNIFENSSKPIVLDADALNCLAHRRELFQLINSPAVMTPHPAEMARLTGIDIEDIKKNRIGIAQEYAKKWNITIVLKGARTVVAAPSGEIYINETGNPGMATAGSGDVLTGIITGFISQGIEPTRAAVAAVYIHGAAGDIAAEKIGEYGLIAGDILDKVPLAIKRMIGR